MSSHRPTTNRGRRAGGDCSQRKQHRSRAAPFGSKGPRFVRPRSCMEAWEAHGVSCAASTSQATQAQEPTSLTSRGESKCDRRAASAHSRVASSSPHAPRLLRRSGAGTSGTTGSKGFVFRVRLCGHRVRVTPNHGTQEPRLRGLAAGVHERDADAPCSFSSLLALAVERRFCCARVVKKLGQARL